MITRFTFYDAKEISKKAYYTFIGEFQINLGSSDSNSDDLDSDLSNFNPDEFRCGEIRPEAEALVKDNWEICDPLEVVYGMMTSNLIKETIETCTDIVYWCCWQNLKKVSPIIAKESANLI